MIGRVRRAAGGHGHPLAITAGLPVGSGSLHSAAILLDRVVRLAAKAAQPHRLFLKSGPPARTIFKTPHRPSQIQQLFLRQQERRAQPQCRTTTAANHATVIAPENRTCLEEIPNDKPWPY